MIEVNLDAIRLALEAKRKELESGSFDRQEILVEPMPDEFDRMQLVLNQEVAVSNFDRNAKLLKDVKAAISRISAGTFGSCLCCEEMIAQKRLKAIPWAVHCIDCQERVDRKQATDQAGYPDDRNEVAA